MSTETEARQGTDTTAATKATYPAPNFWASVWLVATREIISRLRSKAFLHVARHLTRPWRWAYAFRWFPGFILDLFYRFIARIRYRVWGKLDACELPAPDQRARFLE